MTAVPAPARTCAASAAADCCSASERRSSAGYSGSPPRQPPLQLGFGRSGPRASRQPRRWPASCWVRAACGGWTVSFDVSPCRSLVQPQGCRPFNVAAQSVGNDLYQSDLRRRDVGNLAVIGADVFADDDAVYTAVLGRNQAVAVAGQT